jgi:site-specific DNA-methyltransferase (adenine-specific)
MEIVMRKVSELTPYGLNAKKHDDKQVDNVANSIKRFGWQQPIVIDENGVVVIGHCRLMAAKKLKLKEVPVTVASGLTEDEIKELRIADNKTNESPWDLNLLAEDIEGLDFDGFDLDFGVAGEVGGITSDDVVEDDFDLTPPEQPKAKLGDIYQLGEHRLMCGDSTYADAWAKLMDGEKADMVFTDPPYGVAIGDKNATLNSIQPSGRCTTNIANDTMSEEELYDMLKAAFINVRESCHDDAVYFVTSPQGGSLGLMMMMMKDAGLPVRHVLMWMKNSATFSLGRLDYDYQHEPIFYTWTKSHHNYRGGENRTTIWQYDKPRKCDVHPTMKPVELVANAILDGTKEGDIVLDAFGGSGTTMIAAEQLGRKARLMELDPHYIDVIIARWENYTGKKAVLLNG